MPKVTSALTAVRIWRKRGRVMEVYEYHLGGIYFEERILDFDQLYCEQCGDYDRHLGHADTWEDVLELITDVDGWCPYCPKYLETKKSEWMTKRSE